MSHMISGSQDDSEDLIILKNGLWYYRFEYDALAANPTYQFPASVDRVISYESRAYDVFLVKAGEMQPEES